MKAFALCVLCLLSCTLLVGRTSGRCLSSKPNVERQLVVNGTQTPILLEVNGWDTSSIHTYLAGILLEEVLGYEVSYIFNFTGGEESFHRIAGCPDASDFANCDPVATAKRLIPFTMVNLEIWPSGKESSYRKWVEQAQQVENAGILGVQGKSGWYTFTSVVEDFWTNQNKIVENWKAYKTDVINSFETAESDPVINAIAAPLCSAAEGCTNGWFHGSPACNVSVGGDPSYCAALYYILPSYGPGILNQQVANLNLNVSIAWLGNDFYPKVLEKQANNIPILFGYWEPDAYLAKVNATRISLPPFNADVFATATAAPWGPINCDYATDTLTKIVWPQLKDLASPAYHLLRQLTLTNADTDSMLKLHVNGAGTLSSEGVACDWLNNNIAKWSSWIADPDPCTSADWIATVASCDPDTQTREVTFDWRYVRSDGNRTYGSNCYGGSMLPTPTNIACDFVPLTSSTGLAFTVMSSLMITVGVALVGLVLANHKHAIFKRAQPLFLASIGLGSIMGYMAIMIQSVPKSDSVCLTQPPLLTFGFTLMFGSLFAKTFRIWKILENPKLRRVTVSTWHALGYLAIGLLADAVLLSLWFAVDPPRAVSVATAQPGIGTVNSLHCRSESSIFLVVILFYKLAVLIFGVLLAFKVRKLSSDFHEAKWMGMALYCMFLLSAVALPLLLAVDLSVMAFHVVLCICIILGGSIGSYFILLPKIFHFVKKTSVSIYAQPSSPTAEQTYGTSRGHRHSILSGTNDSGLSSQDEVSGLRAQLAAAEAKIRSLLASGNCHGRDSTDEMQSLLTATPPMSPGLPNQFSGL
eukprot:GILK01003986.1.p1 GENE.GILK01003986.1~~GILK01003986.1.p1  ORF type:complete len:822 (+),score=145.46 GILK01003986.1:31-2466(+)